MNIENLLSVFLLDLHFQLLGRHMVRKAESGLSGAVNDCGMQRLNDHSAAREGLGTEVLFTLGGCGVRRAEEIPLQFSSSLLAHP